MDEISMTKRKVGGAAGLVESSGGARKSTLPRHNYRSHPIGVRKRVPRRCNCLIYGPRVVHLDRDVVHLAQVERSIQSGFHLKSHREHKRNLGHFL